MSAFQTGEIVDITIRGVRIDDEYSDGTVTVLAEDSAGNASTWQMPPQAKVERVAPAEWPPRPGDLWRDRNGDVWFGRRYCADPDVNADWEGCNDEGWRTVLTPLDGGPYGRLSKRPDEVNQERGPMTLVHREAADGTDGSGQ